MTLDGSRSLYPRLLVLAILVLVSPLALLGFDAMDGFEKGLTPEIEHKAAIVGGDLADQLDRAVNYGIPIDQLVGLDEFFAPVLDANRELRYLAITDGDGKVLFLRGVPAADLEPHFRNTDFDLMVPGQTSVIGDYADLAVPILADGTRVGLLHVSMDVHYVHHRVAEILIDVAVVLAVSLLLASEILMFVVVVNISGPLGQARRLMERVRHGDFTLLPWVVTSDEVGRFVQCLNGAVRGVDQLYRTLAAYVEEVRGAHFDPTVVERVGVVAEGIDAAYRFAPDGAPKLRHERHAVDVRLPLFLFTFAEELSRPFLPLYIRSLPSVTWLSPEMAMAVPIAVFMACVGGFTPWAGTLTARHGSRLVFLVGLVPAVLGLVMAGLAESMVDLTLWRAATGIGYALITMACQGYIARSVHESSRTQGLGVFVGAVLTASVCGMALGGVLVERVGFRDAFFVAAGLAVLSGLLAWRMVEPETERRERERAPTLRDMIALLGNWRFTVLMVFSAIPSKMALTGVVFFLVPLHLWSLGCGFGDIARMLMVYAVTVVVLSPLVARLADRSGWRAGLVASGGVLGGLGLLAPALGLGSDSVLLALACLGLAQGLSASPQMVLVTDVCAAECRAFDRTNVLALCRLLERIGSTAGPLAAAAVIPLAGYDGAMVALGALVLATALVFAVAATAYGRARPAEEAA